jgi:hypothetical protein
MGSDTDGGEEMKRSKKMTWSEFIRDYWPLVLFVLGIALMVTFFAHAIVESHNPCNAMNLTGCGT